MSAPTILLRNIGGTDDKRIILNEGQCARRIFVGTNYRTLRVGFRYSCTDPGLDLVTAPRVFFGMCKGTTNIPGDATIDHAIGALSNIGVWSRNTGESPPFVDFPTAQGGFAMTRIQGSSTSFAPVGFASWKLPLSTSVRSVLYLEYTRINAGGGNTQYFCEMFRRTSGAGSADVSQTTFLDQIRIPGITNPVITGHAGTTFGVNVSVQTSANDLDCVCASWNRNQCQFEISDIAVMRFE